MQIPGLQPLKIFSRSLEQFFLTVGQNNFGNKIPDLKIIHLYTWRYDCKCEAQIRSIGWKHGYQNGTSPPEDLSEHKNATNEMLRNHLELEHWKKKNI